jgi:hypothetical protein
MDELKRTDTRHVYQGTDGYYFSDEAQELHGPFSTYEETIELLKNYAESL